MDSTISYLSLQVLKNIQSINDGEKKENSNRLTLLNNLL